jgi:hypothetical protein
MRLQWVRSGACRELAMEGEGGRKRVGGNIKKKLMA